MLRLVHTHELDLVDVEVGDNHNCSERLHESHSFDLGIELYGSLLANVEVLQLDSIALVLVEHLVQVVESDTFLQAEGSLAGEGVDVLSASGESTKGVVVLVSLQFPSGSVQSVDASLIKDDEVVLEGLTDNNG